MDEPDFGFEPMEVDISSHSSNNMDISFNESSSKIEDFLKKMNMTIKSEPVDEVSDQTAPLNIPSNSTNIKKFHINMCKEKPTPWTRPTVKVVCAALVMLIAIIIYQILSIQCSEEIKLDLLRTSLSSKLYGQTKAVDLLIEGLSENHRSKILIVYGSTGVGKTLAASILLEHVGRYSNVYHYTMPSFADTFSTDFMVGLTVCKNSFVIVDDLSLNDLRVKEHLANLISKTESMGKAVTIVLIYKCNPAQDFIRYCDESVPVNIINKLKGVKAYKKVIYFEKLTKEHLRRCIETELGNRKISDDEFTTFLKNFDVTVDGCKGVHTRMKLMSIT